MISRLRPLPLPFGMLGCGLMLVLGLALWHGGQADGRLHVIVPPLDGDGVLIVTPDGQAALVDGGADGAAVANWLGQELPFARRHLDLLVLTRADHTTLPGQLAVVRRYAIGKALLPQPSKADPMWHELVRQLREQNVPIHYPRSGERMYLGTSRDGNGVTFEVLGTSEERLTLVAGTDAGDVVFFQSLGDETPLVPVPSRAVMLFYPWRRTTFDPTIQALRPRVVIYGEQPGKDPQRSFAERAIGSARLLHEALDGRIEITLDIQGVHVLTEQREQ